ncbi:MAG: cytochrome c peroxidase [Bacteroidia bacterium]
MLFYEKLLSSDESMSCASCHNQKTAFSDTNRFSIGVQGMPGGRQAMAVFNMAWNRNEFFWDGRAHLLRNQSLMPIQDKLEMNETLPNVIAKLKADSKYPQQFKNAFGSEEITAEKMSKAMEQFMNSIVSYNSKFDRFKAGLDTLTKEEERGRFLFFTEYNPAFPNATGADCEHCHGGPNFENNRYMNNGLDDNASITDIGRQKVTNRPMDKAAFKVPSLRNIALTPPYMHDGRFKTLEEVVDHYNLVKASSTLDPSFQQQLPNGLELTPEDKKALVAFLKTLTDEVFINDPRYSSPF